MGIQWDYLNKLYIDYDTAFKARRIAFKRHNLALTSMRANGGHGSPKTDTLREKFLEAEARAHSARLLFQLHWNPVILTTTAEEKRAMLDDTGMNSPPVVLAKLRGFDAEQVFKSREELEEELKSVKSVILQHETKLRQLENELYLVREQLGRYTK